MRAALYDQAVLHHKDLISVSDCAQSVSDNHNRLLARLNQLVKSLLYLELALSVQGRSSLIQEEHFWFADKCSSDSDTLLLTT